MKFNLEKGTIGIKSNWRQNHIQARLDAIHQRGLPQPKLMELFIADDDIEERPIEIVYSAVLLGQAGIKVVLHEPTRFNGLRVNSASLSDDVQQANTECHDALEQMCARNENIIGFVTHGYNPNYPDTLGYVVSHKSRQRRKALIEHLSQGYRYAIVENVPRQLFATPKHMIGIAADLKTLDSEIGLCVDLPAMSMTYMHRILDGRISGRIKEVVQGCEDIGVQPYFHIGDRKYIFDALPVGKGKIHFDTIIPYIDLGIIEVRPRNELKPAEVVDSYAKVLEMKCLAEKIKYD